MIDVNELLERADEFMADVEIDESRGQLASRLAGHALGIGGGIAVSGYAGHRVRKSIEKGGKKKSRANIQRLKDRHGITAKSFIPRDKYEMQKLKRRSAAGHVGHGLVRGMSPFGVANIMRYAEKVKIAKKGHYRNKD